MACLLSLTIPVQGLLDFLWRRGHATRNNMHKWCAKIVTASLNVGVACCYDDDVIFGNKVPEPCILIAALGSLSCMPSFFKGVCLYLHNSYSPPVCRNV